MKKEIVGLFVIFAIGIGMMVLGWIMSEAPNKKKQREYDKIVELISEGRYLEAEVRIPNLVDADEGSIFTKITGKGEWATKRELLYDILEREREKAEETTQKQIGED